MNLLLHHQLPQIVSGGVVNGKAINLQKPTYPAAANAVHASGAVMIQVTIDENGNVISATPISGHPLLKQAAEQAARASKFSPTLLSGQKVQTTGIIVYNFGEGQGNPVSSTISAAKEPLPTPEMLKQNRLREKLHPPILALVENSQITAEFVADGKAEVEIWLKQITPEIIEKLKTYGFELIESKQEKFVIGKIPIDKIVELVEIEEVEYILPKTR
jgi:TonB family protein